MLVFGLIVALQLVGAQRLDSFTLSPQVNPSPNACQSQSAAVDMARQSIGQSVRELLSTIANPPSPSCGDSSWTRVAYLNMNDPLQQCPLSWRLYSANGVRACGRQVTTSPNGGCYSRNYTVQQSYQRVCGRITGYQIGSTDVFGDLMLPINEPYVDGVSLTYGDPRRHIWTFAAGLSETIITTHADHEKYTCPCALNGTAFRMQQPPAFVGSNYFCESGNPLTSFQNTNAFRYTDDPLWDGQRCEGQCCTNSNSPPWFSVMLPGATRDGIEVRICSRQDTNNEDVAIGLLEIYVQ
jgi:hypothetical protein